MPIAGPSGQAADDAQEMGTTDIHDPPPPNISIQDPVQKVRPKERSFERPFRATHRIQEAIDTRSDSEIDQEEETEKVRLFSPFRYAHLFTG